MNKEANQVRSKDGDEQFHVEFSSGEKTGMRIEKVEECEQSKNGAHNQPKSVLLNHVEEKLNDFQMPL